MDDDDDADAGVILTSPPPEGWKGPPMASHHVAGCHSARSESLQPDTERSSQSGSEQSSVEADFHVWHYALLVAHVDKE